MDKDPTFRKKVLEKDGVGREYLEELVYKIVSRNVTEIYTRIKETDNRNIIWRDLALALARERLQTAQNGSVENLADFE